MISPVIDLMILWKIKLDHQGKLKRSKWKMAKSRAKSRKPLHSEKGNTAVEGGNP